MENTMKKLFITIGLSALLAGVLSAQTQTMNIHIGSTVQQYNLAQIDSITFTEGNDDPPTGFVQVPAGTFMMGDNNTNGTPVHQVTLTNDFYLGINEVTNLQYMTALQWAYDFGLVTAFSYTVSAHGHQLLDLDYIDCEIGFENGEFFLVEGTHDMGPWGPGHAFPDGYDPGMHPVKIVSWYGAACYCDWISMMAGLEPFYDGDWTVSMEHNPYSSPAFTLPTEAEWEYAASYNDERTFPWGEETPDCEWANFETATYCIGWTTEVGIYPLSVSQLGLWDMGGNSWEWVNDGWDSYSSESQTNPLGPLNNSSRVRRGGSWGYEVEDLQCAQRAVSGAYHVNRSLGFRVRQLAIN
jgi:formylglycine-generating enzyme required for sulfatase activity